MFLLKGRMPLRLIVNSCLSRFKASSHAPTTWARTRSFHRHQSLFLAGKMIEVEKKFTVNDAVIANLASLGAVLRKEATFTDVYYDTPSYVLTSDNFWLRQRDGLWQLKSPVGGRTAEETLTNSSYKESEKEIDILMLIMPILCQTSEKDRFLSRLNSMCESGENFSTLSGLLADFNCKPFCRITTRRQSYVLGDFNVDLDITDSGYQVGEIELLAEGEGEVDIHLMTRRIDDLSCQLGVPTEAQVSGKLGHFLKRHNPEHYSRLFKLRVLV